MKEDQKETLKKYASVLNVPSYISDPVINHYIDCVTKNGEEWTNARFKSVKLDFIRLKAGQPMVSLWVSKKSKTQFAGCFGGLQSWCKSDWKRWSKAISLLQIYTNLVSSDVLAAQASKFVDAVTFSNDTPLQVLNMYGDKVAHGAKILFPDKEYLCDPKPLLFYPVSSTKREPHASGRSYPEGENTLECARSFLGQTTFGRKACQKYRKIFLSLMEDVVPVDSIDSVSDFNQFPYVIGRKMYADNVGKIGLIQEPGLKLRAVANPGRVFQAALQPLGDNLYDKLKTLPWDCTHNQQLPLHTLQNALRQGTTVHAIDLSNATDRFPFILQERVLRTIFIRQDYVDLFKDLSRSQWTINKDVYGPGYISWKFGQPLGLYPSFASFALTHGLLLFSLNNYQHDNKFFVLGDDVVILDDVLNARYVEFLEACKVPYSPSKTISSSVLTEFGGKIITPDLVINQIKWKSASDDNFLDIAKQLGLRSRCLLRSRQKIIFDILAPLPDFSGYLLGNKYLSGLGFNPKGIPLDARIDKSMALETFDNKRSFMMSYNGRVNAMNYAWTNRKDRTVSWCYQKSPTLAFDQKAAYLAATMPFSYKRYIPISDDLWKAVSGNPLYTRSSSKKDLPVQSTDGGRNTTLSLLERKLL